MDAVEIVEGHVAVLDRADVDTDQIIPKQFLKRIERTGFGEFLFYDWFRSGEIELEAHPILVAGRNFGSGSSREHAVWALKDYGFDWRVAGCSMCLGMNPDILQPGERCASTSNRNFEGRQGRGGRTHLVSPQMAAAAAIAGHFVDIREWN